VNGADSTARPHYKPMKFTEIASRLTGVSCPVFGIQWNPPVPEVAIAEGVVTFLEGRRVLYNNYELEMPDHCVQSVTKMREFLNAEARRVSRDTWISKHLRAMEASCRRFMDVTQSQATNQRIIRPFDGGPATWEFCSALGELRANLGFYLGVMAIVYGLSIDGELEKILPPKSLA